MTGGPRGPRIGPANSRVLPANDHRTDREAGALVYPVYSRRSGGLSVGINLFPDRKVCSFDCPYCEVFPFGTDLRFSIEAMERGLRGLIPQAGSIKDFCFSGNGEPTLSEDFPAALERAALLRDELAPDASLVVITNGSTLADPAVFELLAAAASGSMGLDVWLKVDAGTEAWFRTVDRAELSYSLLTESFRRFAAAAPFTVQTMLCAVGGAPPPAEEAAAWETLVLDLVRIGRRAAAAAGAALAGPGEGPSRAASAAGVAAAPVLRGPRRIHLYGKSRPAPEDPAAEALGAAYLEERAASLRSALAAALSGAAGPEPAGAAGAAGAAAPPVEVFP